MFFCTFKFTIALNLHIFLYSQIYNQVYSHVFLHIQKYNCFQPSHFLLKAKSTISSKPMFIVHIQFYNCFQPPYVLFKVKSTISFTPIFFFMISNLQQHSTPIFLYIFKSTLPPYFCTYLNLHYLHIFLKSNLQLGLHPYPFVYIQIYNCIPHLCFSYIFKSTIALNLYILVQSHIYNQLFTLFLYRFTSILAYYHHHFKYHLKRHITYHVHMIRAWSVLFHSILSLNKNFHL